jgi:hypothetical protein
MYDTMMKKLSTYLFLILFSFLTPSFADDIRDFEIEGMSIGDSLLDHLSKEEIITEIEKNKPQYNYLTEDFGEVYLRGKFEIYNHLVFFVKPNDKNYIIYDIRGVVFYDDDIEQCYVKQKEIIEEFSLSYKNTRKEEEKFVFPWDPTGKSISRYTSFFFDSGDEISVACAEYEKSLKIENNMVDNLQVQISKKVIADWMRKHIN